MDRVVTEENTKLYRVTVRLGSKDAGIGEAVSYLNAEMIVENPVPVYGLDGAQIGFGTVFLGTFDSILADVSIDYSTPERLIAETKSERIFPWILGTIELENNGVIGSLEVLNLQAPVLIAKRLCIKGIALRRQRPAGYAPEFGATVAA